MKKIHLICNAHIDPVWQWEWDEGAAAAISTFRAAAEFCEEFDMLSGLAWEVDFGLLSF